MSLANLSATNEMSYNYTMLSTLTKSFIEKPKEMCFEGEDKDEEILYVFRKALITNMRWVAFTALLLIVPVFFNTLLSDLSAASSNFINTRIVIILNAFWFLFTLGFAFERFINWFFTVHIITSKRVVDMDFDSILHRNISEAPLRNIEDITFTVAGALQTIFNYGTVSVQTAAEQREIEFVQISNPSKIQDILSDLVSEVKGDYNS